MTEETHDDLIPFFILGWGWVFIMLGIFWMYNTPDPFLGIEPEQDTTPYVPKIEEKLFWFNDTGIGVILDANIYDMAAITTIEQNLSKKDGILKFKVQVGTRLLRPYDVAPSNISFSVEDGGDMV